MTTSARSRAASILPEGTHNNAQPWPKNASNRWEASRRSALSSSHTLRRALGWAQARTSRSKQDGSFQTPISSGGTPRQQNTPGTEAHRPARDSTSRPEPKNNAVPRPSPSHRESNKKPRLPEGKVQHRFLPDQFKAGEQGRGPDSVASLFPYPEPRPLPGFRPDAKARGRPGRTARKPLPWPRNSTPHPKGATPVRSGKPRRMTEHVLFRRSRVRDSPVPGTEEGDAGFQPSPAVIENRCISLVKGGFGHHTAQEPLGNQEMRRHTHPFRPMPKSEGIFNSLSETISKMISS